MKKRRARMIAALSVLLLASAAACWPAVTATARTRTWGDREEGEVVINDAVVMRIRSAAGGYSATQRAEAVAARLSKALQAGLAWQDLRVGEMNREQAVMTSGGDLIVTADRFHAQVNGTTPTLLAQAWYSNMVQALGGEVPSEPPTATAPGTAAISPVTAPGPPEVNWEWQEDKIVPVFSIGTPGVSIGAARVSGPKVEVGKVKAVAQVEAEFRRAVRARIYIPVSSISTKPDRVQGVSVSALIDYNLPL
ncbi:MAG: hypothetical protein JSV65_07175 [Armatimonadota bacterium]|nr:MAG: hypothetical protein JSV65_07175 [Armatimonadota bacterium]